jgi:PadR family transcriptional regulator PadR
MNEKDDSLENDSALTGGEEQNLGISADLIRGHINTIILRSLYDGDKYGYDIINEIEKKSGGLYTLKQPTLYSALKRLESLNYVSSYYGEFSNGGRRKYFSLTELGRRFTEQNLSEWEYSRTIIDSLISDGNAHYDFSFITEKQNELSDLKKTLAAREQALEDEKVALNNLKNELQRERSLLSTQSSSLSAQKSDFIELREKVEAQTAELEEKERALSEKQGEITAKEFELLEKEREIGDAKFELEQKTNEIRELKSLLEAQKAAFTAQETELLNAEQLNA